MTEIIIETIRESPLFKHLSEADLNRVLEAAKVESFEPGDTVISEGGPVQNLYVLIEGRVRVWTKSVGREVDLKTLGRGAYFGEVSLMSGKAATATVEAQGETARVIAIPRDLVLELVETDEKIRKMLEGLTLARAKDTLGKVLK